MSRRLFLRFIALLSLFSFDSIARADESPAEKSPREAPNKKPPVDDSLLRIGFGSCAEQSRPQPIWNVIRSKKPNLFLMLGDNIYADTTDMTEMKRRYDLLGAQEPFKKFRQEIPIYATWDDHDYGLNDVGRDYPKKEESKQLMLDFFKEPKDSPRRQRPGVYMSYMFEHQGKKLQILLFDLRWWRSALVEDPKGGYLPNPDPNAVFLGAEQWQWLEEELRKPADFRIFGSSSQFVPSDNKAEKWANFPHEKKRMIELIDRLNLDNFVFLSGDMHFGELSMETTPQGRKVIELTSSGLNRHDEGAEKRHPNSARVALFDTDSNFGLVTVDWANSKVQLEVFDSQGQARIRRTIPLSFNLSS